MLNMYSATIVVTCATILYVFRSLIKTGFANHKHPLPPGPPRLPVVGNALNIDPAIPWVTFQKWGGVYGDIVYSRLLGQGMITVNSEKIARDFMEKRSNNYSDRAGLTTVQLFGWDFNTALLRYGDEWRLHRRLFHEKMRAPAALLYRPLQMRKTHQLLLDILEGPTDFVHHVQTMSASTIMAMIYGYETQRHQDPLVELVEGAISKGFPVLTPVADAVLSTWPFLIYLPYWFPGAGFQRRARESREAATCMIEVPFDYTRKRMDSDDPPSGCMVSELLDRIKDEKNYQESETAVKCVAATSFAAASETTSGTLLNFILAMIFYPRVQERAQAEIDAVVGPGRLPTFDDRDSLPYIEAMVRESHRWNPVVPLGGARTTAEDDIYEGFYIPKGTTIIPNVWAIARNETKYPNASDFIPERFFTPDGKLNDDTVGYAFGFGRRICAGQYVADAAVWIAIVSLLAAFKFSKAKETSGKDIEFTPQWTTGLSIRPLPFPCRIEPRSPDMTLDNLQQMVNRIAVS